MLSLQGQSVLLKCKWYLRVLNVDVYFLFQYEKKGGLNLTVSPPQTQFLTNRTIQSFVKVYVDDYVGEYKA